MQVLRLLLSFRCLRAVLRSLVHSPAKAILLENSVDYIIKLSQVHQSSSLLGCNWLLEDSSLLGDVCLLGRSFLRQIVGCRFGCFGACNTLEEVHEFFLLGGEHRLLGSLVGCGGLIGVGHDGGV